MRNSLLAKNPNFIIMIINELKHIDSAFDYTYLIHKNVISIALSLLKKMNNPVIYVLAGSQGGLDPTVLFTTNCLSDLARAQK